MTVRPHEWRALRAHQLRLALVLAAGLLTWTTLAAAVSAQPRYPQKPITIYLPYGPGGVGDVTLRMYVQKLAPRLGQQLMLENRPGAGGGIAAKAVLANPPDGYSLFFCGSGMAISMSLFKTPPFDILRDFTQISTVSAVNELLFATRVNSPLNNAQDIAAAARQHPGKLNFGTINPGSTQNLTAYRFKQAAGIDVTVIPYKTVPELITATIRGDVDVAIDYYAGLQPVAGDTRIKVIATTGRERSPLLPAVATVRESGYSDFVVTTWQALAAPSGVPDDVVQKLNEAMVEVGGDADFRTWLAKFGMSPGGSTVAQQNAAMEREVAKWAEVIHKAGLALQ